MATSLLLLIAFPPLIKSSIMKQQMESPIPIKYGIATWLIKMNPKGSRAASSMYGQSVSPRSSRRLRLITTFLAAWHFWVVGTSGDQIPGLPKKEILALVLTLAVFWTLDLLKSHSLNQSRFFHPHHNDIEKLLPFGALSHGDSRAAVVNVILGLIILGKIQFASQIFVQSFKSSLKIIADLE